MKTGVRQYTIGILSIQEIHLPFLPGIPAVACHDRMILPLQRLVNVLFSSVIFTLQDLSAIR